MPWERDIYVELLKQHLKEEQETRTAATKVWRVLRPLILLISSEMGIDLDNLSEEEIILALKEAANTLTIKDASDPYCTSSARDNKVKKEKI